VQVLRKAAFVQLLDFAPYLAGFMNYTKIQNRTTGNAPCTGYNNIGHLCPVNRASL